MGGCFSATKVPGETIVGGRAQPAVAVGRTSASTESNSAPNLQRKKARNNRNVPPVSVDDPGPRPVHTPDVPQPAAAKRVVLPNEKDFYFSTNTRNGHALWDVYTNQNQELGKGTFGEVFKAKHKHVPAGSGHRGWHTVAVKTTAPTVLDRRGGVRIWVPDDVEAKCQEVKTLIRLREENPKTSCCLYLYEYFWKFNPDTGQGTVELVTELLGQELEHWRQKQQVFMESAAKKISSTLLNALDFMHSRGVVHRDLKLQNVLFRVNGDFKTLKIVDFGLAKCLQPRQTVTDFCGSLGYISPEIYQNKPYRFEVDMFAFGVILFRLLSGARPFSSTNAEKIKRDTVNLSYKIEGKNWEGVTGEALKLLRKLLIGKDQRHTAEEAANHEWFLSQEDSILKLPETPTDGNAPDDDFSRAILPTSQGGAPENPPDRRDENRFWLESSVERALNILLANGKYVGRIVEDDNDSNAGLVCVEEFMPSSAHVLPLYIARLGGYTEKDCRKICREVAEIIKLTHENGMAHRNLHMNNFLVDKTGTVLVKGLQYAQVVGDDQPLTGHFGYLYSWYAFKAPEIDSDLFHYKSVDLWSLGALMYMLLTALPPFRGDGVDLVDNKHAGNVVFDMVVPSRAAQKLVEGLLQVDPKHRLTIDEVLNAEWMVEADDVLAKCDLSLTHTFLQDWDSRPTAAH